MKKKLLRYFALWGSNGTTQIKAYNHNDARKRARKKGLKEINSVYLIPEEEVHSWNK